MAGRQVFSTEFHSYPRCSVGRPALNKGHSPDLFVEYKGSTGKAEGHSPEICPSNKRECHIFFAMKRDKMPVNLRGDRKSINKGKNAGRIDLISLDSEIP